MWRSLLQAGCQLSMALLFALSNAFAQGLSLVNIQDQIEQRGSVSGQFIQCLKQGNTKILGSGSFTFEPKHRIKLNFEHPDKYTILFSSDGKQIKTVNNIEQKMARYSPVGSLMFSIISMQESRLESRFEVNLFGSMDEFELSLIPKKRMAKLFKSVEISGSLGLINNISINTTDGREYSISMFVSDQSTDFVCE